MKKLGKKLLVLACMVLGVGVIWELLRYGLSWEEDDDPDDNDFDDFGGDVGASPVSRKYTDLSPSSDCHCDADVHNEPQSTHVTDAGASEVGMTDEPVPP